MSAGSQSWFKPPATIEWE